MKRKLFKGATVQTKRGHNGIILDCNSYTVTIEFECGFVGDFARESVVRGSFRSPNERTYCNIGFIGVGDRDTNVDEKAYRYWRSMFDYSYGRLKHRVRTETSVHEDFHSFQNFADFIESKVGSECYKNNSFQISKNRFESVYSKDTVMVIAK